MRARCGTIPCLPFRREKAPLAAVLPIIRSAAVAARILFASLAAFRYGSCAGRAPKASRHSLLEFFLSGLLSRTEIRTQLAGDSVVQSGLPAKRRLELPRSSRRT